MEIAITGSSGRMGSVLLPLLVSQGHTVHSLDIRRPPALPPGTRHTSLDVRDYPALKAALEGCAAVVHLAAFIRLSQAPDPELYDANTQGSYHVLLAAEELGIQRVCLASSINAIGGIFSRSPRYDYFPLDEQHPSYAEDRYSLSKWVLEQQADAFARRSPPMRIASLRFHGLVDAEPDLSRMPYAQDRNSYKHLWGYTDIHAAARACDLALSADFRGHEAFFIVAPQTTSPIPSPALARAHYPSVPIRAGLTGHRGFYDCTKAERLLSWRHDAPS
jgi:nucleoside-diphosphate-sugar epimerase